LSNNKKINCFLIGVQKAGTSSFYNWLSQHPQINAPKEWKDTHFFSQERYLEKGTGWMESFYNSDISKPVLLAGAVNYIYFPQIPNAIKAYNEDSKFILILRDPVKRAFSAYHYQTKMGLEKRSFEQAIKDEFQNKFSSEEARGNFAYIGHGYYYKQIKNWLTCFGLETFCIHFYEELFKSPDTALQQTFDFLNIDKNFKPILVSENKTGVVKYRWLNNLFFSNPKLVKTLKKLKVDKVIGFSVRVKFFNWLRDWNTNTTKKNESSLNLEMYQQLSKYYEADTANLSELLKKDLKAIWKY
jgi:hypothetical protein